MKFKVVKVGQFTVLALLLYSHPASSEIKLIGETNVFYTSDVSIFSASQRLSLRDDPTQPLLEKTGVGDDFVYEPVATAIKTLHPSWGKMELEIRAQGYLFASHTKFNHGTYGAQVTQSLPADFNLLFRYHFGPDQFVGKNINRRDLRILKAHEENTNHEQMNENLLSERVTTHFGTVELDRKILDNLNLRTLGRYGNRSYNRNFSHRDTDFWTVGAHLEWEIRPGMEFVLGYHFERGLTGGRKRIQFEDDISYRSNYVSAEMTAHLTEKALIVLGFDFEHNLFTSRHIDKERRNGNEKIYQGDVNVRYKLYKNIDLRIGYQHAQRKFTYEDKAAVLNTVMAGSVFRF